MVSRSFCLLGYVWDRKPQNMKYLLDIFIQDLARSALNLAQIGRLLALIPNKHLRAGNGSHSDHWLPPTPAASSHPAAIGDSARRKTVQRLGFREIGKKSLAGDCEHFVGPVNRLSAAIRDQHCGQSPVRGHCRLIAGSKPVSRVDNNDIARSGRSCFLRRCHRRRNGCERKRQCRAKYPNLVFHKLLLRDFTHIWKQLRKISL
jgi:hypothetical protein